MRRVAVVGSSGLVGYHIIKEAESRGWNVLGTFLTNDPGVISCSSLDILDPEGVNDLLSRFQPEGVILAAAVSDVDECERNPGVAWNVNVEGTLNVAEVCARLGCPMLFISSDYVFNGLKDSPYREEDLPDPLNIYGRTKLEGERLVLEASVQNIVCRVSVVFGWQGTSVRDNIVLKVLRRLKANEEVSLFNDQWNTPTYAPEAASLMLDLLSKDRGTISMFEGEGRGIFHLSGRECVSRYELGMLVADVFDLDHNLIRPLSMEKAGMSAPRPRISCLSVVKVEAELNTSITSLREALEDMRSREGES
ncbi:MAG: dTDP-4-dehydrorhamnose reductase [Methanomassiliicoccales archaeon]|nr:dTDP-4-dehydrorhamnose reductase [Methanomassiliicoccales archaeon]